MKSLEKKKKPQSCEGTCTLTFIEDLFPQNKAERGRGQNVSGSAQSRGSHKLTIREKQTAFAARPRLNSSPFNDA